MRYFIDTEFIESGPHKPIDLISIGIVAEDGREFYAISGEFDRANANPWVEANVFPHLFQGMASVLSLATMAEQIKEFVRADTYGEPEFWAYFADYDWVVFCQIFGSMSDLPKGFPMFCRDLKQLACDCGNPELPAQDSTEHNALNDARWNKLAYEFLQEQNGRWWGPLSTAEISEEMECYAGTLIERGYSVDELKDILDRVTRQVRKDQAAEAEGLRGPKS